jgi:hypothetical protein
MNSQVVLMLFDDIIKRDFGGKLKSFCSRVAVQAEVSSEINELNHVDYKIKKKKN